jgi:ubiquinol-cytochrome c reductase cytochrome b subunit
MGKVFDWLDQRVDLGSLKRSLLDREVPDRLTWWHTLGSAALTVFLVQVVTGIVLATFYSPSPDHAYDSILYISTEVHGGQLLRGIHHWAASAMVVLVLAHLIRVYSMGAYKYPREANWVLGVGLFVVVLGFSFTGYLLPWDQKAYWATAVGTSIAGTTPVVGGGLLAVLRGGAELGAATLSRFYSLHVLLLPAIFVGLVLLHLIMVVRQGIAPRSVSLEKGAPSRTSDVEYPEYYKTAYAATKRGGVKFYPDIIGKDVLVSTLVVIVIFVLAWTLGAPTDAPADPTDTAYVPRPEWYFLPLYQLLKLVPGSLESVVAFWVPMALLLALLALPFYDRRSKRALRHRPLAVISLTFILGASGLLLGSAVRDAGPAVPPEVGRPLTSLERAGRGLYRSQHCDDCHVVMDEGGDDGPELTDIGLRHSAGWLHSFIESPERFHGDTTEMPAFGPPTLSHQQVEELAQYLSSLRGVGGLNAIPEIHDTFPGDVIP